jgi:leucyl aminopeptidase
MPAYEIVPDFSLCSDWIIGVRGNTDITLLKNLPVEISLMDKKDFSGDPGSLYLLNQAKRRVLFLGLGEQVNFASVQKVFRQFTFQNKDRFNEKTGLLLLPDARIPLPLPRLYEAAWQGILTGINHPGQWKTDSPVSHIWAREQAHFYFYADESIRENVKESLHRSSVIGAARNHICKMINTPANFLNPATFAAEIEKTGREAGFEVQIIDARELQKKGLNALLTVGQGSKTPPLMAKLSYVGGGENQKHIGLVGKGITFDTGGISIKSSTNMHFMKSDMSGAAAVLGTFQAVANLGLPVKLTGFLPIAENAIGSLSMRPGDIISSYHGKTIEVIDTDAEGRLILADALSYLVRNDRPDVVVNLATLTGSIVATLGNHAAGLFSNNDALARKLLEAGNEAGEVLWRMPLFETVKEDLKSDVADLRNFSGLPTAGAISAAKFLEEFIDQHPAWAHLDIAGVAFDKTEMTHLKAATGFGVRLLTEYISNL